MISVAEPGLTRVKRLPAASVMAKLGVLLPAKL